MPRSIFSGLSSVCLIVFIVIGMDASGQSASFAGYTSTLAANLGVAQGVAVDTRGNVYIASGTLHSIEELVAVNGAVPPNPAIRHLGSGLADPRSVALDMSGNLYIADLKAPAIKEFLAVNGTIPDNPVIRTLSTGFASPHGVAVDSSGDVYVVDDELTVVTELLAVNGTIPANPQTVEWGGGFRLPRGVAVDSQGRVYVADSGHGRVCIVFAPRGDINNLGFGFHNPQGVAVDAAGNVFATDTEEGLVKEVPATNFNAFPPPPPITNPVGVGFSAPKGIAVDSAGNVFTADFGNSSVEKIDLALPALGNIAIGASGSATVPFVFASGGVIGAPAVVMQGASGLDYTDAGTGTCTTQGTAHVYQAGDSCTVDVVFKPARPGIRYGAVDLKSSSGIVIGTTLLFGDGVGPQVNFRPGTVSLVGHLDDYTFPVSLTIDGSGNLYFSAQGGALYELPAGFNNNSTSSPAQELYSNLHIGAIALDGAGNLFLACNNSIMEMITVNPGTPAQYRILKTVAYTGYASYGVAVDRAGNVYFSDDYYYGVNEIVAVNGTIPASNPIIRSLTTALYFPQQLTLDSNGNLFVADEVDQQITEILAVNGQIPANPAVRVVSGGFAYPIGVAADVDGDVFVTEFFGNRISEIFAVDGTIPPNPTVEALSFAHNIFLSPQGLFVDQNGNLYIADNNPSRIYKLDFADPPMLNFGHADVGQTSSDSPQILTVVNSGTAGLNFALPTAGTNPTISPNFTLGNGGTCPDLGISSPQPPPLAPGTSCTEYVSFQPEVSGSVIGSLVFTDDSLNRDFSTQTVILSGNTGPPSPGQSPTAKIAPPK